MGEIKAADQTGLEPAVGGAPLESVGAARYTVAWSPCQEADTWCAGARENAAKSQVHDLCRLNSLVANPWVREREKLRALGLCRGLDREDTRSRDDRGQSQLRRHKRGDGLVVARRDRRPRLIRQGHTGHRRALESDRRASAA